jgi:hypothetical protein
LSPIGARASSPSHGPLTLLVEQLVDHQRSDLGTMVPLDLGVVAVLAIQAGTAVLAAPTRGPTWLPLLRAGLLGGAAAAIAYAMIYFLANGSLPLAELADPLRSTWVAAFAAGPVAAVVAMLGHQGAESLNKQHRQRLRRNDAQTARLPALVGEHLAHADREHLRQQLAVVGEREPDLTFAAGQRSLKRESERLVFLVELFGETATREAMAQVMATGHVGAEYIEYVLRQLLAADPGHGARR